MAWGLVVGESDAAGHMTIPFAPDGPEGVGEEWAVLAKRPSVGGVALDLNWFVSFVREIAPLAGEVKTCGGEWASVVKVR